MKTPLLHVASLAFGITLMFWLAGCDRKPDRVEVPALDPAGIAQGAMQKYDANSDGAVDGAELDKAASLRDHPDLAVKLIDHNSDGKVTEEELKARVQQWIDSKVGIMTFQCMVKLDGQPLEGGTVKFVPEPFMKGAVEEASGTTDANGSAVLAIDDAKLPANLKGFSGMKPGFYMVQITHPAKEIPAKYNTETTLGQEVASDVGSINVLYDLKSR